MHPSPRNCPKMESQKCHSLIFQVLFMNPLNIDVEILFICLLFCSWVFLLLANSFLFWLLKYLSVYQYPVKSNWLNWSTYKTKNVVNGLWLPLHQREECGNLRVQVLAIFLSSQDQVQATNGSFQFNNFKCQSSYVGHKVKTCDLMRVIESRQIHTWSEPPKYVTYNFSLGNL